MGHVLNLPFPQMKRLVQCFAGLAHGTRLEIVSQLSKAQGELSAWDFALKQVRTLSEVNQHLRRLCDSGLIVSRQDGRGRVYRLAGPWVSELLRIGLKSLSHQAKDDDKGTRA